MKGYIPAKKHTSQAVINQSPASLPSQHQALHSSGGTYSHEISTKTFSPFIPAKSGGGFTAELNRINGNPPGTDVDDEDYLVIIHLTASTFSFFNCYCSQCI